MSKTSLNDARADVQHHLHPMTSPAELTRAGASFVDRADGIFVTVDGRPCIDALSGLGCVNIGYGNPSVCEAAHRAMSTLSYGHTFDKLSNHSTARLAAKLSELTHGHFSRFFFGSSGSDAIESAIKLCYYYWKLRGEPQRRLLLSRRYSYHGNTIVATSLTGLSHFHSQFDLPLQGLVRHVAPPYWFRYGQSQSPEAFAKQAAASLETEIREVGARNIAAFVGEPIQATGGAIIPPPGYWEEIRAICDRHDILLVGDEVVTGFGKVGSWFAYESFNFVPDLVVLAKGLTSGYFPMSAVGLGSKMRQMLEPTEAPFEHGFTNSGHPVGAAVALANIAVLENQQLVQHVRATLGPQLQAGLRKIRRQQGVADVRSMGIIGAIELEADGLSAQQMDDLGHAVTAAALRRAVICRAVGPSIVFVLPMIITEKQLTQVLDVLSASIDEVLGGRKPEQTDDRSLL